MNNKKIAIIGTAGVPANYGGFETLVENLIGETSYSIDVYCSSKSYKPELRVAKYKNAKLRYVNINANGVSSIFYDLVSMLFSIVVRSDVLLILGVSGCVFLPFIRLFTNAKIITNIDGLEWKRDKWGKAAKSFLKFSEKMAIRFSDVIISDNQSIYQYVKDEYGVDSHVIAYGGDHAYPMSVTETDEGFALSICRIEPENNVELILQAFKENEKCLKFVGNWGRSEFGQRLKVKYSDSSNIEFIDPIYDINSLAELRSKCHVYVHGHSAGGTNPSLVEIMHFGKPIVCFDCSYNRATTEDKAIYFSNSEELSLLLNDFDLGMGDDMREIARRRYTWSVVRAQYFNLF